MVSSVSDYCSFLCGESFKAFHISINLISVAIWFIIMICSDFNLSAIFILTETFSLSSFQAQRVSEHQITLHQKWQKLCRKYYIKSSEHPFHPIFDDLNFAKKKHSE
jgi:hypothetical protein